MGKITSYLKDKAKQTVQNIQAERAYNKAEKLEQREQFNRGQREASYRAGQGIGALGSTERHNKYSRSGKLIESTERTNYNKMQAQVAQGGGRTKQGGSQWSPDWKAAGNMFGGGFGGGGSFDMFGNGGAQHKKQIPMETTTIDPRTGKVKIQKPYERQNPVMQSDPADAFWGTPGPAGVARRKGERDPTDFIL